MAKDALTTETPFFKIPNDFKISANKYIGGVISTITSSSTNVYLHSDGFVYQSMTNKIPSGTVVSFYIELLK